MAKNNCHYCQKEFDSADLKDELEGKKPIFFDIKAMDPADSKCGHIYHIYVCKSCEKENLEKEKLEKIKIAKLEKIISSLDWMTNNNPEYPHESFLIKEGDQRLANIKILVDEIILSTSMSYFNDELVTKLKIGDYVYWLSGDKINRKK